MNQAYIKVSFSNEHSVTAKVNREGRKFGERMVVKMGRILEAVLLLLV